MSTRPHAADSAGRVALASRRHTAVLVALMLAVALTGALLQVTSAGQPVTVRAPAPHAAGAWARYLPVLLVNWSLTLYVTRLFRAGNALPSLLGHRWDSVRRAATDLAFAVGTLALIRGVEAACVGYLAAGPNAAVARLLPGTVAERLTWVLVAGSVGFCEEVVYRGYLQVQLAACTGRVRWAVLLQAVLFGIAHGEQGPAAALRITGYGLLLGALARVRRSLLPGIACHVGLDLVSGLLR